MPRLDPTAAMFVPKDKVASLFGEGKKAQEEKPLGVDILMDVIKGGLDIEFQKLCEKVGHSDFYHPNDPPIPYIQDVVRFSAVCKAAANRVRAVVAAHVQEVEEEKKAWAEKADKLNEEHIRLTKKGVPAENKYYGFATGISQLGHAVNQAQIPALAHFLVSTAQPDPFQPRVVAIAHPTFQNSTPVNSFTYSGMAGQHDPDEVQIIQDSLTQLSTTLTPAEPASMQLHLVRDGLFGDEVPVGPNSAPNSLYTGLETSAKDRSIIPRLQYRKCQRYIKRADIARAVLAKMCLRRV